MKPLEVIYYAGQPARGRAKAKPPRWVIAERGTYCSLLEITAGVSGKDPADIFAILDIMARDFNGLRLRDRSVPAAAKAIREYLAGFEAPS